ncbi:MAG: thioesterase family protein [Clostridia bacterium]|nr:thioesterase family protein [Clostridia bacterium]
MKPGIQGRRTYPVTKEVLASAFGSGLVDVYATPAMIAAIENTAALSVESELEEGYTTVGTQVSVSHVSATPEGMTVTVETTLTEVSANGRLLTFAVRASDDMGLIGEGTHVRAIVNKARFEQKALNKGK